MYRKIALHERMSRATVMQLHRYLSNFAQGAHRVFWNRGRAFVEVENTGDVDLVRNQFPNIVRADTHYSGQTFPW